MSAIEITRQDLSLSQLRAEAARTADAKQARRILAIAMVLDGHSRLLAAQASAMDRQTLRDWAHRYNADGLVLLRHKRSRAGGPAPAWASAASGRSPAERSSEVGGRRP
jgi:transposase